MKLIELHLRLCGDYIDDSVAITNSSTLDVMSVLHMNLIKLLNQTLSHP